MQSNTARVLLGIAAVALAVVLLVVLKDDGSDDSGSTATTSQPTSGPNREQTTIPTIVVKDGEPVGGIEKLSFDEGEQIRFKVTSDAPEEVHFHGYDIAKEIEKAGGSVSFDVPATIEGIFEVELEGLGEQIAEIQVNPS